MTQERVTTQGAQEATGEMTDDLNVRMNGLMIRSKKNNQDPNPDLSQNQDRQVPKDKEPPVRRKPPVPNTLTI
jgi:hypothetical protein